MRSIAPIAPSFSTWASWEGGFSSEELDKLQAMAKSADDSGTVGAGGVNENIRRSRTLFVSDGQDDTVWMFERLAHIIGEMNAQFFRFDLSGMPEGAQLSSYREEESGCYEWHEDMGGKFSRKLSLVMLLSDINDFDGGDFQIYSGNDVQALPKQRGLLLAFPFWVKHRVTPVVRGSRESLVVWVAGPAFR